MDVDRADLTSAIDLSVLTPRQRLVVTLHYCDNWTLEEIAQALGQRSVRDTHARAIASLRRACVGLGRDASAPIGRG